MSKQIQSKAILSLEFNSLAIQSKSIIFSNIKKGYWCSDT